MSMKAVEFALLIEGDDGTHLGKQEIAGALHHREAPPR